MDSVTIEPAILQNLLQYVLEHMFFFVTSSLVELHATGDDSIAVPELTAEEETVLYYCADYVQRTLLQGLQRRKQNVEAQLYIDIVTDWSVSEKASNNLPASLTEWLKIQNRGGLIQVTDQFYTFVKEVECALRPLLHVSFHRFRDIDMVSSIIDELKGNQAVLDCWQNLVGYEMAEKCDGTSDMIE